MIIKNKQIKQASLGIITLTSWKQRIPYVSITIQSLLTNCKGFKIVLVLSTLEFPNKQLDLPDELNLLLNSSDNIEILWVDSNYKQYKKLLFTLDNYNTTGLPIITADDGCIYVKNYALELYNLWLLNKTSIISQAHWRSDGVEFGSGGYGMLFPPNCFKHYGLSILKKYNKELIDIGNDDAFIGCLAKELNIDIKFIKPLGEKNKDTIFKNIDICQECSLQVQKLYSEDTILPMPTLVHRAVQEFTI